MDDSPASPPAPAAPPSRNPLRRLYHWILSWAHHPMGTWALAVFAFIDSSIFPIPPLFLQVALSLEKPRRSFWYAAVDTVASVAGALVGYCIGYFLFATLGQWVLSTFASPESFERARLGFQKSAFLFILAYSFLPFPYKVITIASGFFRIPPGALVAASLIGRGLRFNLLAALCFFWGPSVKTFIEKYFNLVCLGVAALVGAVLLAMKLISKNM